MRETLDVAVCGCGPAGLAAALLLSRAGHRVRIFERFEQPGPVGSGLILQPTGLGVLAELGLLGRIAALGARIDRLFGRVAPSGRVVLDVRYEAMGKGWQAIAVHRAVLFGVLHEAAKNAGIEVIPATRILGLDRTGNRPCVIAAGGVRIGPFDLVVDALGAHSPLASGIAHHKALEYGALWTNVPWDAGGGFNGNVLEQRYRRASHMAGVLPIGRTAPGGPQQAAFFWSLKRSRLAEWRSQPLDAWKAQVAALWPQTASLLESIDSHDQLTFAQYDHFTAARPYSARLAHIGDSSRATSPQLGQGANMALLDAAALARALETHEDLQAGLESYTRMRRWHVRLFQRASATFTPFYQSDSRVLPLARDWLTAPLSKLPVGSTVLARLVSGMTVAPLRGERFFPWRRSMGTEAVPQLAAASRAHLREMMDWFPDAESTRLWGGSHFVFPFDEESFARQAKFAELPSYALLTSAGQLCGFGQYYLREGRCHLGRLAIAPAFRSRGYGTRMIELLMEMGARALGVSECSLFVMTTNTRAISVYERLGFTRAQYPGNDLDTGDWYYMVRYAEP